MKFFVDLSKKQLIKSAASNVALERLVLKRRDSLAVEVVFVSRNAVATMPAGTTVSVALKKSFSDSNFLASASGTPPILNLNTVPLEALFSATNPSAIPALLEVRWTVPGETTRTATLTAEVQNSVILGTEATPEAIPDGKATQAEAQAGESNEKWMTPLRTAQAIAVLAPPPTWDSILDKPEDFAPEAHTHPAADITDFAEAVQLVSPADHTHLASQVFTTGVLAKGIPALGSGDRIFLPLVLPTAPGQRTVYATPSTDFVIWWNEAIEAWALSENRILPYIDPESLITTSDEGDTSPQTPWEAAWGYDILPLPLGKLTDELLQTFATVSAVNSDKITLQATLSTKADLDSNGLIPESQLPSIPAANLPPLSYQTTRHEGDGITTAFAPPGVLTEADSPSAISVSVNGVLQEPGVDYTLDIANNRLVLDQPLPSGDKIVITRPILLPSATTLTAEQLGAIPLSALLAETQARTAAERRLLGLTLALS